MIPNEGTVFFATIPPITQEQINRFGDLHGTDGPSHTDPEYAKNSMFGGVIVQGALVMAPIFDIGRRASGMGENTNFSVETKFVSFSRPEEALTVRAEVVASSPDRVELSYTCATSEGRAVQVGTLVCEPG
ncbi:MAG: MaoC family dehydratase [Burkholderiaceae bacterium]